MPPAAVVLPPTNRLASVAVAATYWWSRRLRVTGAHFYDADGRLVTCNRNFRELYGYSEEEARPGVHFAELGRIDVARGQVVVGDEYGGGDDYLQRKAEYRRKLEGSFIVQLKDGRWLKTTDRRMSGGGFVSVQVDITEIKGKEEAFRKAMEEAEAATRSKSEFLANISHDLRTPLNAILGFSEMILGEVSGPFENGTYRGYLENIHKGGQLLLSIVNDILDTVRADRLAVLHRDGEDADAVVRARDHPLVHREEVPSRRGFESDDPQVDGAFHGCFPARHMARPPRARGSP